MSIEEFVENLKEFNIDDFMNSDDPYFTLLDAAMYQTGLFRQYSAVMLDFIRKEYGQNISIRRVKEKIDDFEVILYNTDLSNSIVLAVRTTKEDEEHANKVSVLPLMCGSGKSTALTLIVINTIIRIESAQFRARDIVEDRITEEFLVNVKEDGGTTESITDVYPNEFDGILIVTDSKERLRKIWNPDTGNPYLDDNSVFIERHQDNWVSVMTEENSVEEEKKQRYAPVLCITTQRYFGWKKDEILDHLKWEDDLGTHKRSLIIFDEQPYLNEVRDISVKTINDIDTVLRTSLDDEVSTTKKKWCFDQWNKYRSWFFDLLDHYEYDFKEFDTLYYEPERHTISEDDEQFFGFIETHRSKIRAKSNEAYNNLYAIQQFMKSWSIFSHRDIDTGEYSNKFTVFIDNRDKVTNLGAKVIVLDGTGNISPIYSGQDYIHIQDGVNFLRSLSYLSIKLGDFATSKEDFRKREIDVAKTVLSYLKLQGYEKKDMVFFTYMGRESKFQARINGKLIPNVAHFGDIRGKNDFTSQNSFAQVGLNRMQPVHYLVHVLGRNEDMREMLAKCDPKGMYERIQQIYTDDKYTDFMTLHILADIDQCMFRSAIRNSDNLENVNYYLFYKQYQYPKLRSAIENRYHEKLGANIEYISEEDIIDASGAGNLEWRIRQWVAGWDGAPIKQSALLKLLNTNRSTFNTLLRRKKYLSLQMDSFKETAKAMGYKGTWYAKRIHE